MSQTATLTVLQHTMWTVLLLSAPVLITALTVGLLISLLQAVTQVNEQAINFVPKIAAIALILVLSGSWMLQTILSYTAQLYTSLPQLLSR